MGGARPERGDERPGVQESATRVFDGITAGDGNELDTWAREILIAR